MLTERIFFFIIGALTLCGIWLTGFEQVHWLLYIPLMLLATATLYGTCPLLSLIRELVTSMRRNSDRT